MMASALWVIVITLSLPGEPQREFLGPDNYTSLKACYAELSKVGESVSGILGQNRIGSITARCERRDR